MQQAAVGGYFGGNEKGLFADEKQIFIRLQPRSVYFILTLTVPRIILAVTKKQLYAECKTLLLDIGGPAGCMFQ